MRDDPKVERQARQLAKLPPEFARLAEWGWGELRASIAAQVRRHGLDVITSEQIAARVARIVVTQVYGDVKLYHATRPPER